MDNFILSLYQQLHQEPVHDLEPIDAAALLHTVHQKLKERLGGDYFASFHGSIMVQGERWLGIKGCPKTF